MKLAVVVPRYGAELLGGPEHQCRLVAEHLAARHQVDVLTTCAADAHTWTNVYPEGADRLRGVTVRRFPTARTTDPLALVRSADRVFFGRHSRQDEMEWLRQRGPWSPALVEYLEHQHGPYDVLVFFTAMHALAILGLRVAPYKSVLVPAVHDGPELQLALVGDAFAAAAGFAWQTEEERRLVAGSARLRHLVEDVIGGGVDLPGPDAPVDDGEWRVDAPPDREPLPPHLEGPANAFRRRHRLYGPFVLQAGRVEPGHGCEELLEYFHHYVHDGGEARLVLMGSRLMPLPEDPGVRFAGILSDEERPHSLEAATVVVVPSPDDHEHLLALEALSVGTPILVNARAGSTVHLCRQSQGGLFYADRWEFAEALKLMVRDAALRTALGRSGRAYVTRRHRWSTVVTRYEGLFEPLCSDRTAPQEAVRTASAARPAEPGRARGRPRDRARDRGRQDRVRSRRREGR